jgi:hypothetical protein
MKKDNNLEVLRDCSDFQKALAKLEAAERRSREPRRIGLHFKVCFARRRSAAAPRHGTAPQSRSHPSGREWFKQAIGYDRFEWTA